MNFHRNRLILLLFCVGIAICTQKGSAGSFDILSALEDSNLSTQEDYATYFQTGKSMLHLAVEEDDLPSVKTLLPYDLDKQDSEGKTPLCIAAQKGYVAITRALLQAGANPNIPDNEGYYPLYRAVTEGCGVVAKALLNAQANCNALNGPMKLTALHIAAHRGHLEEARLLIGFRASVNVLSTSKITPLFFAASAEHDAMVELLLENGANPEVANVNGTQALHIAAAQGRENMVRMLLKGVARQIP